VPAPLKKEEEAATTVDRRQKEPLAQKQGKADRVRDAAGWQSADGEHYAIGGYLPLG
jgi:hypothetical protein